MFFKMKYEVPKESEGSPMMCISKQTLSDCCVFQDAQETAPFNGHKRADTPEFFTSLWCDAAFWLKINLSVGEAHFSNMRQTWTCR